MSEEPASARAATCALGVLLLLATASLVFSVSGPPEFQMSVSLLIAGLKALLIAAVFMGLARARTSMRLALLIALIMTLVLLVFVGGDVWTRPYAVRARDAANGMELSPGDDRHH